MLSAQNRTIWTVLSVVSLLAISHSYLTSPSNKGDIDPRPKPVNWSTSTVYETQQVDRWPKPVNLDEVKDLIGYPQPAYDSGIQGKVRLKVLIDEHGHYVRHNVSHSFHPLLRIPCEVYIPLLRFKPATLDGKPVKCWVEVPFLFVNPDYGA